MNRSLKNWAAAAALTLTAGLALTACGSDEKSTDSPGDKPVAAGGDLTAENFIERVSTAQMKAGSSHVSLSMEIAGQKVSGEGDMTTGDDPADAAMAMTMDYPGMGKMDMRLVEGVMYLNIGPLTQNKFIKVDLADADNPLAEQYGSVLDQIDPAKQFELFEKALIEFERAGDVEKIDGVDATPYRLVLDTQVVMEAAGAGDQTELAGVPETLEYTMFIGDDDLPRRLVMDLMGMGMTMDYSKWGDKVTVEAPPADQISDQDPFAAFNPAA